MQSGPYYTGVRYYADFALRSECWRWSQHHEIRINFGYLNLARSLSLYDNRGYFLL